MVVNPGRLGWGRSALPDLDVFPYAGAVPTAGLCRLRRPKPTAPPSSSGLGHRPFKAAARVRIPLGARAAGDGSASSVRAIRNSRPAHFCRTGRPTRPSPAVHLRRSACVSGATKLLCTLGAHPLSADQVEQRTERPAHLGSQAPVTGCRPVGGPHYRLAGGMLIRAKAVCLLKSPSRGHVDYGWRYEVL